MNSRKKNKTRKLILFFISCFVFGLGYYFLNVVSKINEVPMGAAFHIIFGCFLMTISGAYITFTLKKKFFPTKRKRIKRMLAQNKARKNQP